MKKFILVVLLLTLNIYADNIATVTANPYLHIRSFPGLNGDIIGKVGFGESLRVIDLASKKQIIAGKSGRWVRIKNQDGFGYVFNAYLKNKKLNIDCSNNKSCEEDKDNQIVVRRYVTIETEELQPNYSLKTRKFLFTTTLNIYEANLEAIIVSNIDEIPIRDRVSYKRDGSSSDIVLFKGKAKLKVTEIRKKTSFYGGIGLDKDMARFMYFQKYPSDTAQLMDKKKVYIVGEVTDYQGPKQYDTSLASHQIIQLKTEMNESKSKDLLTRPIFEVPSFRNRMYTRPRPRAIPRR